MVTRAQVGLLVGKARITTDLFPMGITRVLSGTAGGQSPPGGDVVDAPRQSDPDITKAPSSQSVSVAGSVLGGDRRGMSSACRSRRVRTQRVALCRAGAGGAGPLEPPGDCCDRGADTVVDVPQSATVRLPVNRRQRWSLILPDWVTLAGRRCFTMATACRRWFYQRTRLVLGDAEAALSP